MRGEGAEPIPALPKQRESEEGRVIGCSCCCCSCLLSAATAAIVVAGQLLDRILALASKLARQVPASARQLAASSARLEHRVL